MGEVAVGRDDRGLVVLRDPRDPYGDGFGFVDVDVELRAPGLAADSRVRLLRGPEDLTVFLDELARRWRGWDGDLRWDSLERELSVEARHDGLGHVALRVTLADSGRSGAWRAGVEVAVEAGEELRRLAHDVRALLTL